MELYVRASMIPSFISAGWVLQGRDVLLSTPWLRECCFQSRCMMQCKCYGSAQPRACSESGTEAINLTFHCEISSLCQPLSVSLLFHLRNDMQLIVQTPLKEKGKNGGFGGGGEREQVWWMETQAVWFGVEGGRKEEVRREGRREWGRRGGVPEERQNTGPETQLVIWWEVTHSKHKPLKEGLERPLLHEQSGMERD